MLEEALTYLEYGWSVIPVHTIVKGLCTCGSYECQAPGKHPRLKWSEFTTRKPSENEVKSWFQREFPGSNVGLVTGSISGVMVVDCDGKEGVSSAREHLELPFPTLVSLTGGGGFHLFYRCGKKLASQRNLYPRVDLKAENGFVVLPPSIHVSGYNYEWFRRYKPAKIDLTQFKPEASDITANEQGWYNELLKGVDEGERSDVAAKLAGRYAMLGVDLRFLLYGMMEWNRRNRPPLPQEELENTVAFILRKHAGEARPGVELKTVDELLQWAQRLKKNGGTCE